MSEQEKEGRPSLGNHEIVSRRSTRRGLLRGALAATAGGVTLAVAGQQQARAAADTDSGNWRDNGACPRGYGGIWTGITDSDDGNITDRSGYGRGTPYC